MVDADVEPVTTTPTPTPYEAAVLDFLTEEGFRARLDEEGDVYFKYQGMTYVVITRDNEPTVLQILLPYFWPLEDALTRTRAMEAAMDAHKTVRIGRIIVWEDNVSATVNAYLSDEDSFRAVLLHSVDGLAYLAQYFREQLNARSESG